MAAAEEAEVVEAEVLKQTLSPGREPKTPIFPQETSSGVICITSGARGVTFALSPPPVLGRTSRLLSLQNE